MWFVESVVCKKDSHSLGNILSFAKWIGHRERESPEFLCRMHHAESGNSLQQDTWHLLWVGPTLWKCCPLPTKYCLTLFLYCYYNFLLATARAFASAAKFYIYFNIRITFLFYFHTALFKTVIIKLFILHYILLKYYFFIIFLIFFLHSQPPLITFFIYSSRKEKFFKKIKCK